MSYCTKCGNTGILLDGSPCGCKLVDDFIFSGVACTFLPEQYQGVNFNPNLVSQDMPESYAKYLYELHNSIITLKHKHKNVVICSPVARSKTIMCYSAIQDLFRKGIETFPIYDVLELRRIIHDMDLAYKQIYTVEEPEKILTVPYLFVRIPIGLSFEVYSTIALILQRRVARGNSTIFIYNGSWESLTAFDSKRVLINMLGDGSFNTLENKTWFPRK